MVHPVFSRSAVACATLGVGFVGIELDEHYLQEAVARTKQALSERARKPKTAL